MFKFIFIFLLVVGAVTTIPPIRERAMPPISRALGPTGEKMMMPIKKWQAKTACTNLLRELATAYNQGKAIPDPGNFYLFAREATNNKTGDVDPWGKRYYLMPGARIMKVGSNGPDGKRGTPDDIVAQVPWG